VTSVRYNHTIRDFAVSNALAGTPAARGTVVQSIVALMDGYDAGLFGMLAPRAFGGVELHPTGCLRVDGP
jgi:hypothetical protein